MSQLLPSPRLRSLGSAWLLAVLFAAAACAPGEIGQQDRSDAGATLDAAIGAADATPGLPDALAAVDATPEPPDAQPASYPAPPYGYTEGSVIADLSWTGFVDTAADADLDPFNQAATEVRLADFYVGFDPASRILLVNQSAGWCSSCQEEMPQLADLHADYRDRGGRIVVALWQNDDSSPATLSFVDEWGTYFQLTNPTVADPDDRLGPYFQEDTIPMNLLVDTATMEIVDVIHGYDDDQIRQVFEAYADPA
jgi:thiol-disulfide isomerase/thioredoxin